MSYIQYTDDSWWKHEKEDDDEDARDIGGSNDIEPMPPPNVNMGDYNARYGNFETRFGIENDNKRAQNNSNTNSNKNPISQSSQSFTLGHFIGIMVIVIIIIILYRRYTQFRKENLNNY